MVQAAPQNCQQRMMPHRGPGPGFVVSTNGKTADEARFKSTGSKNLVPIGILKEQ